MIQTTPKHKLAFMLPPFRMQLDFTFSSISGKKVDEIQWEVHFICPFPPHQLSIEFTNRSFLLQFSLSEYQFLGIFWPTEYKIMFPFNSVICGCSWITKTWGLPRLPNCILQYMNSPYVQLSNRPFLRFKPFGCRLISISGNVGGVFGKLGREIQSKTSASSKKLIGKEKKLSLPSSQAQTKTFRQI